MEFGLIGLNIVGVCTSQATADRLQRAVLVNITPGRQGTCRRQTRRPAHLPLCSPEHERLRGGRHRGLGLLGERLYCSQQSPGPPGYLVTAQHGSADTVTRMTR